MFPLIIAAFGGYLIADGYQEKQLFADGGDIPKGKNTEAVKEKLYVLFEQYRNHKIDDSAFVDKLKRVCSGSGNKSYWWRFFEGDTAANDWRSVSNSLESKHNTEFLNECIDIALTDRNVIVYYS